MTRLTHPGAVHIGAIVHTPLLCPDTRADGAGNPGDRRGRAGYRAGVPSTEHLLAFLLAGVVLVAIPGPSVLFIVGRALAHGRRAALPASPATPPASSLIVLAVALGIGAVAAASAAVFSCSSSPVRRTSPTSACRPGGTAATSPSRSAGAGAPPGRRVFWQGVVVGATNPKVLVLFVALLPQFTDPDAGSPATQMLVLGLLFTVIAATLDSVWGLAAGAARDWFATSPARLRRVGGAGGLMMIGLGATLALTGRRD